MTAKILQDLEPEITMDIRGGGEKDEIKGCVDSVQMGGGFSVKKVWVQRM